MSIARSNGKSWEPMTCIEGSCERCGVQVLDGSIKCKNCGGDLFPFHEVEIIDEPSDVEVMDSWHMDPANFRDYLAKEAAKSPGGRLEDTDRRVDRGNDTFTCPSDLTGCPIASRLKVYIPYGMFNKWVWLAGRINTEWIAYLYGNEREDNPDIIEVTGMYFPKQRVTPQHCEAEEGEILPGTIGTVHSHVRMQAYFSGEDIAHFNHPVEIVLNASGDIKANGRTKLECGRFHRGDAEVFFIKAEEATAMEKELKEKMTRDNSHFKSDNRQPANPGGSQLQLWRGHHKESGGYM